MRRHGDGLYSDVFLDRPQGLLVVFRAWDVLSDGNTAQLRDHRDCVRRGRGDCDRGDGSGAALTVGRVVAGTMAAVLLALPSLEGYTANGEILASAGSAVAVAIGCAVLVGRLLARWMIAAGVMAGVAFSMKQSGIDGLAALSGWPALAALFGWEPRRTAIRLFALLWGGAALVFGLLALHGAITNWSGWRYVIQGYRRTQRSVFVGAEWDNFWRSAEIALPVLLPLLYVIGSRRRSWWSSRGACRGCAPCCSCCRCGW